MTARLLFAALAALAGGSAAAASPPPERPTEWSPERAEAPAFFCAAGMGLALRPGETLQTAKRRPWALVGLGPLTRLHMAAGTLEIQWPALAYSEGEAASSVYRDAHIELVPVSQDSWALSLQPGRGGQEGAPGLDDVRRMIVVRFPVGEHSSTGLEVARRIVFMREDDRSCTARAEPPAP